MKKTGWMLMLALLCATASHAQTPPRAVTLIGSEDFLDFSGAGPGDGVETLQALKLAFEFDAALVDLVSVTPDGALAGLDPSEFDAVYSSGRVVVNVQAGEAVTVDDAVLSRLLATNLQLLGDLYDGERVPVRLVGAQPGDPVLWIDAFGVEDPIKVSVIPFEFVGNGGISCVPGDALGDGRIHSGDAVAALRMATGALSGAPVLARCGADINQDGYVRVGDGVLILRRAAGFGARAASPAPASPTLRLTATAEGCELRIGGVDALHGVFLRARAVGAVELSGFGEDSGALSARFVSADEARLGIASASAVGEAGEFRVRIDAGGTGRVVIDRLELYGADGQIIHELDAALLVELGDTPIRSREVALGNRPNPFNPGTTIWYELPEAGRAVLELFDVRGRRLATLIDEPRPAGRSTFEFRAGDLASGVYFVRLRTGQGDAVHRMTLVE